MRQTDFFTLHFLTYVTIQQIAEALGMTVDIIDPKLADLAPLKRLT